MMYLPRGDEYNQAIQNPRTAFRDEDLKICQFEKTNLGLPKPYSGNFTTTYHLFNYPTKDFAVRCFTRQISDLEKRYKAISNFLRENKSNNYFVNAEYLDKGINVNGKFYPIIKMDWSKGSQLNFFISNNLGNRSILEKLLENFKSLVVELENKKIAHGDLQHGNIIVRDSKIVLIDYDGMYLESIKDLKANEIGHPNYQHPLRTEKYYDHRLDYFSSIVIYICLQAVIIKPDLWNRYDNGENMLFKASDFKNLESAPLVKELDNIAELKPHIANLRKIRYLEFEATPSLSNFIQGKVPKANVGEIKFIPESRFAYPIFDAKETDRIALQIGKRVEIIGVVEKIISKTDKNNEKYLFLLLGTPINRKFGLRVIYWPNFLKLISKLKLRDPIQYDGKLISITGVVEHHKGLCITIDNPAQVQLISDQERLEKNYLTKKNNQTNSSQPWYHQNRDFFK
jgi:hypothetical protein